MGQTLSEPVTDKHTASDADDRFIYAVSEMQGWRITMEDAHTTVLKLDDSGNSFFAVFDGHGGSSVAKFAGDHVHTRLVSEEAYREKEYEAAFKKAFMGTDDDIRADPAFFHDPSGCTAVAALITADNKIYVANAGDSRSVMSVRGEAKPLSFDHKPQNKVETARITAAGGYIEFGRVNGNLALSRAIGDFEFKQNYALGPERQVVTSDPDVTVHDITEEDEFVVLACDGIWDCLSSQQVISIVRRQIAQRKELTEICELMMDTCLAPDSDTGGGIGCDNMTVMVVALLNGRTKEEWYDWVADRVEKQIGYDTPEVLPQIYAPSRVLAATERANRMAARGGGGGGISLRGPPTGFSALARVLGGTGISFHPSGGGISSDDLMFDQEDSDEYESGEEDGGSGSSAGGNAQSADQDGAGLFGVNRLRAPEGQDVTNTLRAQLEELDEEEAQLGEDIEMTDGDFSSPFEAPQLGKTPPAGQDQKQPTKTASIISSLSPPTSTGSPLVPTPSPLKNLGRTATPASTSRSATDAAGNSPTHAKPAVNGTVEGVKATSEVEEKA